MAIIVSPFGFFEMQMKGVFRQSLELSQSYFCHSPKAFNAVDMNPASCELILGMIYTEMAVAKINQPVIAAPSIGVYNGMTSTLPRIIPCRVTFLQSGTTSV